MPDIRVARPLSSHPVRPAGTGRAAHFGLMVLLTVAVASPALASGAWQWLDDAGRRVYSDMPPPATVPERRIVKRPPSGGTWLPQPVAAVPATTPSPTAPNASQAGAAASAASALPRTPGTSGSASPQGAAGAAAAGPGKANATEAERLAQEQRNAAVRADNCARARASLLTLESGARLMVTSPQGEQVPMDEPTRAAELARVQLSLRENCR